jgi:hypothetical protein
LFNIEKLEASLVRVNAEKSKIGFINSDNFVIQLIVNDKSDTRPSSDPSGTLDASRPDREQFATTIPSVTSEIPLSGARIQSLFHFDQPSAGDREVVRMFDHNIYFLPQNRRRSIEIIVGNWESSASAEGENFWFDESIVIAPLVADRTTMQNAKTLLKRHWPGRAAFQFYQGKNRTVAVAKTRPGMPIDLGSFSLQFSPELYSAVYVMFVVPPPEKSFYLKYPATIIALRS